MESPKKFPIFLSYEERLIIGESLIKKSGFSLDSIS